MSDPRLTIAIPLHGAGRWIDTVVANVGRAPASSRVVISDASGLDDSADRLAGTFADDERVSVVKRDRTLDWIAHANLLLEQADTELFCWMPQDDLVSPDGYFDMLVAALDANPDRVLAFPTVLRRVSKGRIRRREVDPLPFRGPPIGLGSDRPEIEAVELLRKWNLGIAWRGVFRRSPARPIPGTPDLADRLWAFSMALAGSFIEVPAARYLKRFHRGSAHRQMRSQGRRPLRRLYAAEVETRLTDPQARIGVMKQVDRYLIYHRRLRLIDSARSAGAFALKARRPVLESPPADPAQSSG